MNTLIEISQALSSDWEPRAAVQQHCSPDVNRMNFLKPLLRSWMQIACMHNT